MASSLRQLGLAGVLRRRRVLVLARAARCEASGWIVGLVSFLGRPRRCLGGNGAGASGLPRVSSGGSAPFRSPADGRKERRLRGAASCARGCDSRGGAGERFRRSTALPRVASVPMRASRAMRASRGCSAAPRARDDGSDLFRQGRVQMHRAAHPTKQRSLRRFRRCGWLDVGAPDVRGRRAFDPGGWHWQRGLEDVVRAARLGGPRFLDGCADHCVVAGGERLGRVCLRAPSGAIGAGSDRPAFASALPHGREEARELVELSHLQAAR